MHCGSGFLPRYRCKNRGYFPNCKQKRRKKWDMVEKVKTKIKERYARRRVKGQWKRDDETRSEKSEKIEKLGQHLTLTS
jgi:hypothetical protein